MERFRRRTDQAPKQSGQHDQENQQSYRDVETDQSFGRLQIIHIWHGPADGALGDDEQHRDPMEKLGNGRVLFLNTVRHNSSLDFTDFDFYLAH